MTATCFLKTTALAYILNPKLMPTKTSKFVNPQEVLKTIGVKQGMKVADFGCGSGTYSLLLARTVGENGQVYAVDVLPSALEAVASQAKLTGIFNIQTVRANLELKNGSGLESDSCDIVLLSNILFQSKKHTDILKEAQRVCKRDGQIVVIDWIPSEAALGPNQGQAVAKETVVSKARGIGLKLKKSFAAGTKHYGLIFSK